MDHSQAHLMEYKSESENEVTILSKPSHHPHSEMGMQHQQQQHQLAFFKKLAESIKSFDELLLFGPTEAKTELFHALRKNHHFDHVKIEVRNSDKLTEPQQFAFVKKFFSTH